ncbi:hypothetical protein GCM10022402_24830 [Salinactinospora qingdaonensis]|uniref:Uncharacterized protein n=1 Tax=Salinactinospora qingdaonensis TaxID=702744 RepID=A0ABP7FPQ0_9ACTN
MGDSRPRGARGGDCRGAPEFVECVETRPDPQGAGALPKRAAGQPGVRPGSRGKARASLPCFLGKEQRAAPVAAGVPLGFEAPVSLLMSALS